QSPTGHIDPFADGLVRCSVHLHHCVSLSRPRSWFLSLPEKPIHDRSSNHNTHPRRLRSSSAKPTDTLLEEINLKVVTTWRQGRRYLQLAHEGLARLHIARKTYPAVVSYDHAVLAIPVIAHRHVVPPI